MSSGINFITTNQLHPFYITNEYEKPILLKCTQFDILADCRLGQEIKLKDNEIYNIYYSNNIYTLYKDIDETPIGEFKYLDTLKMEDLYFTVRNFDFANSYIKLNSSVKVEKRKRIKGKVGPNYENVADCYLYDFLCIGNNKFDVHCRIYKNDSSIVEYDGNYTIHKVENYSLYIEQNITKENTLLNGSLLKDKIMIYLPSICFIIIATVILFYALKFKKDNKLKDVNIVENYIPETSKLNN